MQANTLEVILAEIIENIRTISNRHADLITEIFDRRKRLFKARLI